MMISPTKSTKSTKCRNISKSQSQLNSLSNWYIFNTYILVLVLLRSYKRIYKTRFPKWYNSKFKKPIIHKKNWSNSMSNHFIAAFFAPLLNNTHKHVIDKYFVELIAKCFRFKWYRCMEQTPWVGALGVSYWLEFAK